MRFIQIGLIFSLIVLAQGLSPPCCSQVTGSCRMACEQISMDIVATNRDERQKYIQMMNKYCPLELDYFWKCINDTLTVLDRGEKWPGRPCCYIPLSDKCKLACLQAQSKNDLLQGCRQSDEIEFYSCLERQEVGEKCCNNAQTPDCRRACKDVFVSSQTPNHQIKTSVEAMCSQNNIKVINCVQNYTRTTPSKNPQRNLHCCDKSENEQCRTTCRKILRSNSSSQEVVMDTLIEGGCGHPLLHDSLWQCFLTNSEINKSNNSSTVRIDKLGTDSAKLHCCFKATTINCQKVCFKTFSNEWSPNWKSFHSTCLFQPEETQMLRCLEEVEEPCELGCEGLSYCSNFNSRPTEMFRSCNTWSDYGAKKEMELWRSGFINTSAFSIPILDSTKCLPSMWKAIACMLALKPCTNRYSFTGLCRSDCINGLTSCIDYTRLPQGVTPETICALLTPTGHDLSCTPLATYLERSPFGVTGKQVSFPCRPNPCNSTDVCLINRDCGANQKCSAYQCVPGCRMGDSSSMIIPQGSLAFVPTSADNSRRYKVCRCSDSGVTFEECIFLQLETEDNGCLIGGKRIAHKATFKWDCNICACFAGEVTCSNRACRTIGGIEIPTLTGLPCNCPDHYVPVCGINGKTYPSACVALCGGLLDHDIEFGACGVIDPCQPNPCKRHQRCVPMKRVCLLMSRRSCPQYECVDSNQDCSLDKKLPACDSSHHQHNSLCALLRKDRVLSYVGPCLKNCRNVGPVCGQNGESYATECAAWADRVLVDYFGPCISIGITKDNIAERCKSVQCPSLPHPHCHIVIPPGSCCPTCGASLKLLYSQKQVVIIESVLKTQTPLTVKNILEVFRQYIKVSQCDVFGYLSIEGDIVLVVTVVTDYPTTLQYEACSKEAEKLTLMVQLGSPSFLNNFKLSAITAAVPDHVHNTSTSIRATTSLRLIILLFISVMLSYVT